MNIKRITGTLLLVAGIAVLIVFAIADKIGIGESPEFGAIQISGVIAGAILAVIGLLLLRKGGKTEPPSSGQSSPGN